jgi:hypothetical protein
LVFSESDEGSAAVKDSEGGSGTASFVQRLIFIFIFLVEIKNE